VTSGKIRKMAWHAMQCPLLTMQDQSERSTDMGSNTGKKDKGNKEQRKKPKLSIKEKRKAKNEKKNK
jgi:hypothetical protein